MHIRPITHFRSLIAVGSTNKAWHQGAWVSPNKIWYVGNKAHASLHPHPPYFQTALGWSPHSHRRRRHLSSPTKSQDASRLVFVSVRDAKPKRKVAVPIPENGSWDLFISQVSTKLKLAGVGAIYLSSTGERVLRLDQLQDIDELYVVESTNGPTSSTATNNGNSNAYNQPPGGTSSSATALEIEPDSDHEGKYVKRQTSLQRTAKRMFPSLFSNPSLPITTKDVGGGPLSPVEQVRRQIGRASCRERV